MQMPWGLPSLVGRGEQWAEPLGQRSCPGTGGGCAEDPRGARPERTQGRMGSGSHQLFLLLLLLRRLCEAPASSGCYLWCRGQCLAR